MTSPLPSLEDRFDSWADQLNTGHGFLLVRDFPVDSLSAAAVELAYVGLGLHLGTPVSQDAHGSLLGHVRDERIPQTVPPFACTAPTGGRTSTPTAPISSGCCAYTAQGAAARSRIASCLRRLQRDARVGGPDLVDVHVPTACTGTATTNKVQANRLFYPLPIVHRRERNAPHLLHRLVYNGESVVSALDSLRQMLRHSPTSPMRVTTVSPSARNRGGVRAAPTPPGVPVAMMSPGASVMIDEM